MYVKHYTYQLCETGSGPAVNVNSSRVKRNLGYIGSAVEGLSVVQVPTFINAVPFLSKYF